MRLWLIGSWWGWLGHHGVAVERYSLMGMVGLFVFLVLVFEERHGEHCYWNRRFEESNGRP